MKKRILAALLACVMVISLLPATALAASWDGPEDGYSVGDTFVSEDKNAELPDNIPSGTAWSGPVPTRGNFICDKTEHTHTLEDCYQLTCEHEHNDSCYPMEWVRCTREDNPDHYERHEFWGQEWYEHRSSGTECEEHRFGLFDKAWAYQAPDTSKAPICGHHSIEMGCYELTCTQEEHTHDDECYEMTYTWTLGYQNDSKDNWRAWWPVYWGFERSSSVRNEDLVTVESGANTVTYADGEVGAQDALNDEDAANAGMLVSSGVQITVEPGYYLTGYRLVCGNYTGCGVATRSNNTDFTGGNYSSTVDYAVGADTDSRDGMHINHGFHLGKDYPIQKPNSTEGNLKYGSNQIYPFYLLLRVEEDDNRYSVTYNWGDLAEELTGYPVPESSTNLKRNENVLSEAPSDEAVAAALAQGYVFTGWKVEGTGYAGDALVNANHNLVITGDLTLTAQWEEAGTPDFTEGDLKIQVQVNCTNEDATHEKPTDPYGLIEASYSGSSSVNSDGDLEYTVTVTAAQYVARYDTDTGATHAPTDGSATVTYVYGDEGWEVKSGSSTTVTFDVACEPDLLNGTAVTVQVYVDGEPVTNPDMYVDLSRNTEDTTRDLWEETVGQDGIITCDFNFNTNKGHDCVDIDVKVTDDDYVLQGITYFQSYGSGSPEDVDNETSGTYTIDNVTAVGNANDPDVKIYLRTPYSVKYYVDGEPAADVEDNGIYIEDENVTDEMVAGNPTLDAQDESGWMNWKNDGLLTEITVKGLPSVSDDKTIDGWWLNDEDCTGEPPHEKDDKVQVSDAILTLNDHVIKFYAKTDDAKVPGLTVKKALTSVTRGEETLTDLDGFVAQVGDTLHYTITVTNTGNTEQSGTITDTFTVEGNDDAALTVGTITKPEGCTVTETDGGWTFGELPATETITISASYKVKPGDKSIRNSVDVDSNVPNTPDDPNKDDDTVDTDVASLTVEKTADRKTAFVGDTITYTITVTNTGDVELTDVEVTDDMMPDTVTVKTGVSEATTETAENGAYTIDTLEAGSVVIITYTYMVTAADAEAGKVANVVTADSDQTKDPDPEDSDDPGSDTTETTILPSATKVTKHVVTNGTTVPENILSVIAEKDLTVTYPAPAPVDEQGNLGNPQIAASAGETITLLYEISVFGNEGASFTVTEESGANFIGAVGAEGEVIRTLSEPPQYAGQIGEGARYATLYFTKTFEIGETTTTLTNSITAVVNGEEEDVTEEVDVVKPGLNVDKTVKINGEDYVDGMVANEKDVLTYTITVKNTGKTAITDTVTVSDSMWIEGKVTQVNLTLTEDGKTITLPANVSEDGTLTVNPVSSVDTVFEPGETWTFTYTYTVTAEDVIAGSVSNTVTAESGNGDESTDEVKVPAGSITITPANITIYTGGKGYKSVIGNEGATGVPSTGLPEPGYYIELPTALDAALKEALEVDERTTLDLSDYLTFLYDDGNGTTRTWKLERYDDKEGNTSQTSEGRYIYRILPDGTSGIAVRLQFTDGGEITTDDIFALSESNLYQTYSMTIYAGDLNQDLVQAVLDWPDDKDAPHHDVTVGSGELTVRGITDADGEATTTEIAETAPESEVNNVTAVIDADTKLYINESSLEVADTDSVELLVDSVVSTAVQDLKDSAVDQVSAITDDHEAQFYYLDLVDTDNGNTVVTTKNEPVTLFFPYPEGTDADTAFHIVHYVNQDRDESAKDEIAGVNEGSEKFAIEVYSEENQNLETTDQGIQITVTSFSPFGLFWEEDSGSSGGHTGGGGSSRPSRPTLNTEDHYSYIIGYSDGTLQPYGTITRGEVATIFFRLLTDDSREEWWSQVNDYSDCNSDLWCNNAISTLSNMGIIDGFSDGTFRPYAKITRAQFAKIAVGFFETTREDYQGYFTDVDIDAWYTEYVEAATRVGLIEGFNDGTFRPNTNITRAQACVIVNRALGRAPDEDRLLDEDEMITWPDNNPDDWFYADMQEATNSHDYTWTTVSGDKVENWTDKLPQRDWAALEHAWSTAHSAPGGEVTE